MEGLWYYWLIQHFCVWPFYPTLLVVFHSCPEISTNNGIDSFHKIECVYFVLDLFAFLPLILCVHCCNPGQIKMLSLVCKELEMVNSIILDYAICQPLFWNAEKPGIQGNVFLQFNLQHTFMAKLSVAYLQKCLKLYQNVLCFKDNSETAFSICYTAIGILKHDRTRHLLVQIELFGKLSSLWN
jgi:hypothetical protein